MASIRGMCIEIGTPVSASVSIQKYPNEIWMTCWITTATKTCLLVTLFRDVTSELS